MLFDLKNIDNDLNKPYSKEEVILKAQNLSLNYGEKEVLRDINFEVRNIVRPGLAQGQIISLIGSSGCGKSSLVNVLAGLIEPNTGEVFIDNGQKRTFAGAMGMVFQDYYVYPWRKVNKILEFAISKNKKFKKEERKSLINELANDFGILEHLDKYPGQLSGGQRQRVAIAEQLLSDSNFLCLDEPFSGLDSLAIDKVVEMLLKVSLSDELKTLIIISHDLTNSVAISDTVYVMGKEEGKNAATIKKEICLIDRNLAWRKDIKELKEFHETLKEIKSLL